MVFQTILLFQTILGPRESMSLPVRHFITFLVLLLSTCNCEAVSYQFCGICLNESRVQNFNTVNLATLQSSVESSVKTNDDVPLATIHVQGTTLPQPCLTHDVVCFGSQPHFSPTWEIYF